MNLLVESWTKIKDEISQALQSNRNIQAIEAIIIIQSPFKKLNLKLDLSFLKFFNLNFIDCLNQTVAYAFLKTNELSIVLKGLYSVHIIKVHKSYCIEFLS